MRPSSVLCSWIIFIAMTAIGLATDPVAESKQKGEGTNHDFNRWLGELSPAARQGYEHLIGTPYLPADFDREVVWRLAKESWKRTFEADVGKATNAEIAEAFWNRFGLTPRPELPSLSVPSAPLEVQRDALPPPLQYVVTEDGSYVMNCFACHGGKVAGVTYPGAPNNRYALQTLTEETRLLKIQMGKPLSHMDLGSAFLPLGSTRGTSNAVMFGVALMHFRDADLNVLSWRPAPRLVNHDMDPPPWWHFKKKHHLYIDGFAEKGHRGLMQFMLVRQNGPEKFRNWEEDFRQVYEFISSVPSPKYTEAINADLARKGEKLFVEHCSSCHGTYGDGGSYPELVVSLDEIGTDPVRHSSLSVEHRRAYGESWFALHGKQNTFAEPSGYVAPPLDGVWASAPYFHNGSVPTLWHVLNPESRPVVWKRISEELDREHVGLLVETPSDVPEKLSSEERREYFDTRVYGKNASGHDFPVKLLRDERVAVLEYLKTL